MLTLVGLRDHSQKTTRKSFVMNDSVAAYFLAEIVSEQMVSLFQTYRQILDFIMI
jgi:hypothetical protein